MGQKGIAMITEMTNGAILEKLGKRLKEYRLRAGLMQSELAKDANISLSTVIKLEQGKPVSMILLVSVMRALGMLENFDQFIPEPPVSPMRMLKLQGKTVKRIRRGKSDV